MVLANPTHRKGTDEQITQALQQDRHRRQDGRGGNSLSGCNSVHITFSDEDAAWCSGTHATIYCITDCLVYMTNRFFLLELSYGNMSSCRKGRTCCDVMAHPAIILLQCDEISWCIFRVGQNRISAPYTVYVRMYGDFPAKNTVCTLYIPINVWFWPTLVIECVRTCACVYAH